ncbi:MAG TPA: DUF3455 domain-containing protein [Steroidobacteraceae bacterium]|nr:DUF3455 domain-containing protein [Steroidobacteraceae bacterium]
MNGQALRRLCIRASLLGALAAACGCAHDRAAPASDVPPALQVPAGQRLTHVLHGTGVQIYQCTASGQNPARYSWILQAPAADLSDRSGKDVGRHYEGPTWEADDGSKVVGELVARADAPAPGAVPWLLLRARSNSGKGIFGKVRSIQRLHTIGGLSPDSVCDASHAGERVRVPYSADYYFYVARR